MIQILRNAYFALVVGLVSAGPAIAQTDEASPRVETALFVVEDADTTIYLYPAINSLPPDIQWLDSKVQAAFDEADELAVELDLSAAPASTLMSQIGVLPSGERLSDILPPEVESQFDAAVDQLGISREPLERYRPWLISMVLWSSASPEMRAEHGVPAELVEMAGDKSVTHVEQTDEQLGVFASLSRDEEIELLLAVLGQMPVMKEQNAEVVKQWLLGDIATARRVLERDYKVPAVFDAGVLQRAHRYADWVHRRLDEPGTVFLALSAGLFSGEGGLLQHLETRDITTRRVQ